MNEPSPETVVPVAAALPKPGDDAACVLDLSSLSRAAHAAVPARRTAAGEPVAILSAVWGRVAAMLGKRGFRYFVACIDPGGRTWRQDLWPEYKAGRSKPRTTEVLIGQTCTGCRSSAKGAGFLLAK